MQVAQRLYEGIDLGGEFPVVVPYFMREIIEQIAPLSPVYQAGTLSGNPIAMAAGLATLERLRVPGSYGALEARSRAVADFESQYIFIGEVGDVVIRVHRRRCFGFEFVFEIVDRGLGVLDLTFGEGHDCRQARR